jgi:hypothetical protein
MATRLHGVIHLRRSTSSVCVQQCRVDLLDFRMDKYLTLLNIEATNMNEQILSII